MKGRPSQKKIDIETFLSERKKCYLCGQPEKRLTSMKRSSKLVSIAYQLDTEVKERKKWRSKYGTQKSMKKNF